MEDDTHTKKVNIDEIEELRSIPEIDEFLSQKMGEAKEKFKDQIKQFRGLKRESEKRKLPSFQDGWSRDKSYFFELNRIDDPESQGRYKWELGKFKLEKRQDIVRMIFSDEFIQEIDQAKIAPQQIQNATIKSTTTDKSFEIDFMKGSVDRVVGFVKEIGKGEEKYVTRDTPSMGTFHANGFDIDKEQMYQKMHRLMEKMKDVREDIFFYLLMVEKSMGETSNEE